MNCLLTVISMTIALVTGQGNPVVLRPQTGHLIGSVSDSTGSGIGYANAILVGTNLGAMTRENGVFVVPRVPVGRYSIRAVAFGYASDEKQDIEIKLGETTEVHFTLKRTLQDTTITIPPFMLTPDAAWAARSSIPPETPLDNIIYPDSLTAIQAFGLDFQARYQVSATEESTIVNVVSFGKNNSEKTVALCGVFVFVEVPFQASLGLINENLGLGGGHWEYPAPNLKIGSQIPVTSSLKCETDVVHPGEIIGDTLGFTYLSEPYSEWPGEVRFWCLYYSGTDGSLWEDTKVVDVGVLVIPIR